MSSLQVCILTAAQLCHNPRAYKEAQALGEAGYRVRVLGASLDPWLKARDEKLLRSAAFEFQPVLDLTSRQPIERCQAIRGRAYTRVARAAHRLIGRESPYQLGPSVAALAKAARSTHAELYIAHMEPALFVARQLRAEGRKVAVDFEDWHSESLSPQARRQRPLCLLRSLERELLHCALFSLCPSQAMSRALARAYGCPPPLVLYNAFPRASARRTIGMPADRTDCTRPSIHWFSQTLGAGRGLETLLAALPLLRTPVEVHLRGRMTAGYRAQIDGLLSMATRAYVVFHDLVDNEELPHRIAEHDIGFAGELLTCRNYELTVTNKILQYLQAGLAVVASDTEGHREVANRAPGAVRLFKVGDPVDLAEQLNDWLNSAERLQQARRSARTAADVFCWERQRSLLLKLVAGALAASPASGTRHQKYGGT